MLQNQSREESVNDGGLGLADVLGNADAILDGIALDTIGEGLNARDEGSKAETKMVALKVKNGESKLSRQKAKDQTIKMLDTADAFPGETREDIGHGGHHAFSEVSSIRGGANES